MFREQDHPRDEDGKFTFKNGGSGNKRLDTLAHFLFTGTWEEPPIIKETRRAVEAEEEINQSAANSKFIKPVDGKIRCDYGWRKPPVPGASQNHEGLDLEAPIGTPVKSITGGKVTVAGPVNGYGIAVYIDHGVINGKKVVSVYGHLSKCGVKVGDKVTPGQIVAKSGNTGRSSGPHLHITITEDGKAVDPKKYLKY